MQGNKSSGTKPELTLRATIIPLFEGVRDGKNYPGKPDLMLGSRRSPIAIFVDGCYWHCCPYHGTAPKIHAGFWRKKFEDNIRRDHRVNRELADMGFYVVRIWECRIKNDLAGVVRLIRDVDENGRKRRIVRTRPWARK